MSLKPLRDFIVVSVVKREEKPTNSLLYIPPTGNEKVVTGKVVAAGIGHLKNDGGSTPLLVKPDDMVLFNKQLGVEVEHDGSTFFLVREEHILSIVE